MAIFFLKTNFIHLLKFLCRVIITVIMGSMLYRFILITIDLLAWILYPFIVFHRRRHLKLLLVLGLNNFIYFLLAFYFFAITSPPKDFLDIFKDLYYHRDFSINSHLIFFHLLIFYIIFFLKTSVKYMYLWLIGII
jgi:hypothetical protein